jgi:hypothetical protein
MHRSTSTDRLVGLAKVIAFVSAISLAGCASMPGGVAPTGTQYKGDAVWNIA